MKKSFVIFAFLIISLKSFSQDIHFSQFYFSPLTLNPALTGDFDGDWRISNNYRNQWKSVTKPFNTLGIAYDRQFYIDNEHFSGGLVWVNDKSGAKDLTVNKIFLSLAYHKTLGIHNLSAGYQAGWVSKALDRNLTFPQQFNIQTGQFDSQLPSYESDMQVQLSYLDMNLGLNWSTRYKKWQPEVGFSVFHLNRPNESFTGERNPLGLRKVFTAGARYSVNKAVFVFPKLLFMSYQGATDFMAGALAGTSLAPNKYITGVFGGFFFRTDVMNITDAGIVTAGVNFKRMTAGISYDINISRLNVASNYKGALEFSLVYTGISTRLNKLKIPCERY